MTGVVGCAGALSTGVAGGGGAGGAGRAFSMDGGGIIAALATVTSALFLTHSSNESPSNAVAAANPSKQFIVHTTNVDIATLN